jgi:hypothetical protein
LRDVNSVLSQIWKVKADMTSTESYEGSGQLNYAWFESRCDMPRWHSNTLEFSLLGQPITETESWSFMDRVFSQSFAFFSMICLLLHSSKGAPLKAQGKMDSSITCNSVQWDICHLHRLSNWAKKNLTSLGCESQTIIWHFEMLAREVADLTKLAVRNMENMCQESLGRLKIWGSLFWRASAMILTFQLGARRARRVCIAYPVMDHLEHFSHLRFRTNWGMVKQIFLDLSLDVLRCLLQKCSFLVRTLG